MQIMLNGKPLTRPTPISIEALLREREADPACVVVEINEAIVPREAFAERLLQDGDRVEVVQFVGGG